MNTSSRDIYLECLSLFTNTPDINPISKREDFSEVEISFVLKIDKIPSKDNLSIVINLLNDRDYLHLSIHKEDEIVENFTHTKDDFDAFIKSLTNKGVVIGDDIKIILTIVKNAMISSISVYYIDEFIAYLKSLSFLTFLNVVEKHLANGYLILENQNSLEQNILNTKTIIFSSKHLEAFEANILDKRFREDRINNATTLCHWDLEKKYLLPEDLFPINSNNANEKLLQIFRKCGLLYTAMFIFDYSSLKESYLLYKLNGYKTFGEEITTTKIEDIVIEHNSFDFLYKIYHWIYSGGNTNDKISIARNIISLNFNSKTLQVSATTFDSILSNYKIYERQNVRQYIEVRNKLSEMLIDLQSKIDKIVDGFISDFKKNIITLISFFISVIVIRVISKGDFIGGFTNEIIILSFSFLVISIGVLIYSRWEFSQRVTMFDKHYEQLRERYKELLSEEELNNILDKCNPKNNSTKSFVHQQKIFYSLLWICSIIVLMIALVLIYLINNLEIFSITKILLKSLLCFTKSM